MARSSILAAARDEGVLSAREGIQSMRVLAAAWTHRQRFGKETGVAQRAGFAYTVRLLGSEEESCS